MGTRATLYVWMSEDTFVEYVLSSHLYMGFWAQTQVARLA